MHRHHPYNCKASYYQYHCNTNNNNNNSSNMATTTERWAGSASNNEIMPDLINSSSAPSSNHHHHHLHHHHHHQPLHPNAAAPCSQTRLGSISLNRSASATTNSVALTTGLSPGFATSRPDPFTYPVPLPHEFSDHYNCAQSFIRRRNERERERVRCVNEGYERLRRCVPTGSKDKRISKVEILRSAIRYIDSLQSMLTSTATSNSRAPGKHQRSAPEEIKSDREISSGEENEIGLL